MKNLLIPLCFLYLPFFYAQDLFWANRLGGSSFDQAYAVASDTFGNVYTSGSFEGTGDFDPGPATAVLTSSGDADVFISKLDADGQFVWAKRFGGTSEDYAEALLVDAAGNLFIIGYFNGTADFDPGPGTTNLTAAGDYDMYVSKFDADGDFIWARRIGGTDYDQHRGIALDSTGNIVLTGQFSGTADFDPGAGTSNLISQGANDIAVYKLNASGNFLWAKRIGGSGEDFPRGITVDHNNDILLTGRFSNTVDFNPGAGTFNLTSAGNTDAFLVNLDESGNFGWAAKFGSTNQDEGLAVHASSDGFIYATGFFQGTVDFDPGPGTSMLTAAGAEDVYLHKLGSEGNHVWARRVGGSTLEKAHAIAVDADGAVYISGYFTGMADFDPGPEMAGATSAGNQDAFVLKLDENGNYAWHAAMGGAGEDRSQRMTLNPSGGVYAVGYFAGSVDFDPGQGISMLTAAGELDVFVVALTNVCLPTFSAISPVACDGFTSPDGTVTWTSSGTYTDTLLNAEGCDSIITIQLTILNSSSFTYDASACGAYASPGGTEIWTESGIYSDTIPNGAGCDSIVTVNLTILESTTFEFSATECDLYVSPSGLYTWTESGDYQDTLINASGCDSVMTIHLTILEYTTSTVNVVGCDSYLLPDGTEVTESGTYEKILINAAGCDSIITFNVSLVYSTESTLSVTACDSYTSPSGNQTWTESGVYSDILPNAAGCDSLVTIDLVIEAVNTGVSSDGITLVADMGDAFYQWIDCDNGGQPIAGETNQQFLPQSNGFYAVVITVEECVDTSECVPYFIDAVKAGSGPGRLQIYPNPSAGSFSIDLAGLITSGWLCITDIHGQEVYTVAFYGVEKLDVELDVPPGLYVISISHGDQRRIGRLVKY